MRDSSTDKHKILPLVATGDDRNLPSLWHLSLIMVSTLQAHKWALRDERGGDCLAPGLAEPSAAASTGINLWSKDTPPTHCPNWRTASMSDLQKNLLQYLLLSSSLLSQFTGLPFHPQFSGLAIGLEVPHGSRAKGRGAQMLPGKH